MNDIQKADPKARTRAVIITFAVIVIGLCLMALFESNQARLVDWFVARKMAVEERDGWRAILLLVSLFANLGLLGFFKYAGFMLENFVWLAQAVAEVTDKPISLDSAKPNLLAGWRM